MKIVRLKLFRFSLPLVRLLAVKKARLKRRQGFLVVLVDEADNHGIGEISPLPGWSTERSDDVLSQLRALREILQGQEVPADFEKLSGAFEQWLGSYGLAPSVRFGIETAVLHLFASRREVPLRKILSSASREVVSVNGLLPNALSREEILEKAAWFSRQGYRAVKLKVGGRSVKEDAELARAVRAVLKDRVSLRLDANRSWDIRQAELFFHEVSDLNIEYLEEPVEDFVTLFLLMSHPEAPPVAYDESLQELSPEKLRPESSLKAVVIKPTGLGLERAMQWARRAHTLGITPVVSSMFESGVGIRVLAEVAASLPEDVPAGLDTLGWLAEDVMGKPLKVTKGKISLPSVPLSFDELRQELLEEVF